MKTRKYSVFGCRFTTSQVATKPIQRDLKGRFFRRLHSARVFTRPRPHPVVRLIALLEPNGCGGATKFPGAPACEEVRCVNGVWRVCSARGRRADFRPAMSKRLIQAKRALAVQQALVSRRYQLLTRALKRQWSHQPRRAPAMIYRA